ncbi:hypothetical protein [Kineococcus sp. SYSU DK005]|uniref:hypothetical protein n=1 Tax=Kineococcus sp. SYSU DK005 TaxID=3383126 RepID=UPI003D7DEF8F
MPAEEHEVDLEELQELEQAALSGVRLLPTEARDMVPSAVRWATAVHTAVKAVPSQVMLRPARRSLSAVVWVLAAAADFEDRIPASFTAAVLAREAGVGARVWQQRTAWLRQHGWLEHDGGAPPLGVAAADAGVRMSV